MAAAEPEATFDSFMKWASGFGTPDGSVLRLCGFALALMPMAFDKRTQWGLLLRGADQMDATARTLMEQSRHEGDLVEMISKLSGPKSSPDEQLQLIRTKLEDRLKSTEKVRANLAHIVENEQDLDGQAALSIAAGDEVSTFKYNPDKTALQKQLTILENAITLMQRAENFCAMRVVAQQLRSDAKAIRKAVARRQAAHHDLMVAFARAAALSTGILGSGHDYARIRPQLLANNPALADILPEVNFNTEDDRLRATVANDAPTRLAVILGREVVA